VKDLKWWWVGKVLPSCERNKIHIEDILCHRWVSNDLTTGHTNTRFLNITVCIYQGSEGDVFYPLSNHWCELTHHRLFWSENAIYSPANIFRYPRLKKQKTQSKIISRNISMVMYMPTYFEMFVKSVNCWIPYKPNTHRG